MTKLIDTVALQRSDPGGVSAQRSREPSLAQEERGGAKYVCIAARYRRMQVFSLCYGTVHEEVNHLKRAQGPSKWKEQGTLVSKISEEGVTFKSYRCAKGRF